MPAKSLLELLPRDHVVVPLNAATVDEAIAALVRNLLDTGAIPDRERTERLLQEPKRRNIVSVGDDVVLPHYRTNLVEDLILSIGVAHAPLRSDAEAGLDTDPRIVILVLAPADASTLYLQTVAAIARLLRDEDVVARLIAARTADDVFAIEALRDLRVQPSLAVRDIMIHEVDSVPPGLPLRDAVDLMVRKHIRALPVVGDKLEVLGIISEHDVMRGLLSRIPRVADADRDTVSESSELLRVRDVMTRSVLCVSEDLGLTEAANLMNSKNVEQLPVTSEGKLTGFLTRGDIIRKLFAR
ncbi:MAG: CBS domain-containing protein [Longimicrobiales bacterium]